jgi:capsular exopolysaccharide synthesis family protein
MGSMVEVLKKMHADQAAADDAPAVAGVRSRTSPGIGPIIESPPAVAPLRDLPSETEPRRPRIWKPEDVDPGLIAFHERGAAITEQYRAVRARIISQNTTGDPQLLAITSAVPLEGKTITTMNLGLIMAESRELKVAVLDADLRRASLGRTLGYHSTPGLADVLMGRMSLAEVVQETPAPNLDLIAAGNTHGLNIAEILASHRTREVFGMLQSRYDYVLIDTPPATTVADVCTLAPLCHHIIVVILMNRTPEPLVQKTVRLLQTNNGRILGCVLTRYHDRRARYYYDYYRYYYRRDSSNDGSGA